MMKPKIRKDLKERQRAALLDTLFTLRAEYHERARPIIRVLADLAASDPPAPIVLPDGTTMKYIGPGYDDERA